LLLLLGCRPPPAGPVAPSLTAEPLAPMTGGAQEPVGQAGGGRPMVIDLYASWCESCRDQIPNLKSLATRHAGRLVVVGVNVGEEPDVARRFAAREGIDYATYLDPDFKFADSMGITQLPALLVVDADGKIVHRARELDAATRDAVEQLVR
jgi:cytochrome c biogenesis protein CcmG/thiol:disulfide interchange protein DsbE